MRNMRVTIMRNILRKVVNNEETQKYSNTNALMMTRFLKNDAWHGTHRLPSTGGEDVLVTLVPPSFHNLENKKRKQNEQVPPRNL